MSFDLPAQHLLDAFFATANQASFSLAAKQLHITQSALSQRVQQLEGLLGTMLFVRNRKGIKITETGQILLRYCRARLAIDQEFLSELGHGRRGVLSGPLRIGGYSSVNRSMVLPALAKFLRQHPEVQLNLFGAEMRTLPKLLLQGEVDFLLLDSPYEKVGVESVHLGFEENVLAESRNFGSVPDVYLDHDVDDATTVNFFSGQKKRPQKLRRVFLDDVYGLFDGAALGLGRVVVPRHLLAKDSRLKEVSGYKAVKVPVILHYLTQPYYSELHMQVRELLVSELSERLAR